MHGTIAIEEKPSGDDKSVFKQMLNDDEFLATLSDKKEKLYLKLNQGELDGELKAASNLLNRYRVWVNDQMEDLICIMEDLVVTMTTMMM